MPPIRKFTGKSGKGLEIAVWLRETGHMQFTISKRYMNKQTGQWTEAKSFFLNEARSLYEAADALLTYAEQYEAERPARQAERAEYAERNLSRETERMAPGALRAAVEERLEQDRERETRPADQIPKPFNPADEEIPF